VFATLDSSSLLLFRSGVDNQPNKLGLATLDINTGEEITNNNSALASINYSNGATSFVFLRAPLLVVNSHGVYSINGEKKVRELAFRLTRFPSKQNALELM
jgi:hypothetical protein